MDGGALHDRAALGDGDAGAVRSVTLDTLPSAVPGSGPGPAGERAARTRAQPAPEGPPPADVRAAVIVAGAGSSRRMGAPKLLLSLAGRPVLTRTLEAIRAFSGAADIVVAVKPGTESVIREQVLAPYGLHEAVRLVPGGQDRQSSVAAALAAVSPSIPLVAVHDGARPLAGASLFARVCQEAMVTGGATVALPARETLHTVDAGGLILDTPPRASAWMAQTPQAFDAQALREVHGWAARRGLVATDDAALFRAAGREVRVVEGDPGNIKITFPEDLAMAEAILRQREARERAEGGESGRPSLDPGEGRDHGGGARISRVGMGWDVHRLEPGRRLVLGGVTIPHTSGLTGHSDADVLAHAVMDAVLGAAAMRDIGIHFPPADPAYAGADSIELLRHVAAMVRAGDWTVSNVDATVVAEAPKLAPHYAAMCRRLAEALGIPAGCVNVKATTSEGLGFTGRGEGISAYAVALLERLG